MIGSIKRFSKERVLGQIKMELLFSLSMLIVHVVSAPVVSQGKPTASWQRVAAMTGDGNFHQGAR